jgi:23S rRNA (guanine745-N1)-methyltransferase
MNLLICPVCKGVLEDRHGSLKCQSGHSFDLAAAGYVNLMLKSSTKQSGDSGEMIAARHIFLEKGYYACLCEALSAQILKKLFAFGPNPVIIDSGCGEGYYTTGVLKALETVGIKPMMFGLDLSKAAVKKAAKRRSGVFFAVASVFEMPLSDSCADIVIDIFAPLSTEEFRRVLLKGGYLFIVAPGKRHLFGLKEFLYEHPYENEDNCFNIDGFETDEVITVRRDIKIEGAADIASLFMMTPYYWKTPAQAAIRLQSLTELDTLIEFEIHVLKRL